MKDTKRLAYIAILSAVSTVLMIFPQFPIIPGADFLKVEFSIIPIMIGYFIFDLKTAYVIILLRSLLKLLINNEGVNTMIGLPMNMLAVGVFVTIFALIAGKSFGGRKFILGGIGASLVMTLAMVLMNYFYAIPLYAKFAGFDIKQFIGVGKYLLAMVAPFNLVQGLIYTGSLALILGVAKQLPMMEKGLK
ncbi:ECF transporter S component [Streptococcaceae bacterium ESL0729]|nr:ECF transporter S component [Streptococcaceae bacterium ESL0729]